MKLTVLTKCSWRNADKTREEEFKRLIPLVRFPLMDIETIVQVVDPSGALSDKDLMDVTAYIVGGGANGYGN